MKLKDPIIITARLLPGVRIGNAFVSIEYSPRPGKEGRTRYLYHIDLPGGGSYHGDDLQSGCQGGNLQQGMESLLSFLSAASYDSHLFTASVNEWAKENEEDILDLAHQIEETPGLIEE